MVDFANGMVRAGRRLGPQAVLRRLAAAAALWLVSLGLGPGARAESFAWSTPTCISAAPCTQVGSVSRYPNVIAPADLAAAGNRNRDLLVTIVSTTGGATMSQAPSAGAGYLQGQVLLPGTAPNASQVVFRLDFVQPGTTTPDPLAVPVYLRSIDTDGNESSITGGVTERIEFMPPTVTVIAGAQLEPTGALDGGIAYRAAACTTVNAAIGCLAVGNYPTYSLASAPASVAAEANYNAGVSTMTFAFGGEVPAAGSGGSVNLPRLFGMQGGVIAAPNMTSQVVVTPTLAGAGAGVSGSLVCRNAGTTAATDASCTVSAVDSTGAAVTVTVGACTASSGSAASLPVGATLTCPISYTQPGVADSGSDALPTAVSLTSNTGATNEPLGSTGDNSGSDSVATVDALDDGGTSTPAGSAASVNVLGNDQVGTGAVTTGNVSLTVVTAATSGSSFDAATGQFSVPATAAVGSYTVTYRICANPAQTPAACDQATATITVTEGPDMTSAVNIVPTQAGPGSVVSGTLVCSNVGAAAATAATCTVSGLDSTGASVPVTVGACTASAGSVASLPAGATLSCPIEYTQPGASGGADTAATGVSFSSTSSASNEPASATANNSGSDSVATVDALDDGGTSTPAGSAASVNVLGNDQVGTGAATTGNVSLTVVTAATSGS
ncbi:MAG: hypothetical protein L6Q75_10130, partial [Burkholderiaceae bacterium]|nr:hypothetical protein [Burkholderiaceae bacterium]